MTVRKWKLQNRNDPADAYTFVWNPNAADAPFAEKNVTLDTTVGATGTVLLMEGNTPPAAWQFSGIIRSQAEHDALLSWYRRNYRVYLFDDLGHRMTVYLTAFLPTREAGTANPWRMKYTMKAIVIDFLSGF